MKKQKQSEYEEKGVRYMMCNCGTYVSVGDLVTTVTCSHCVSVVMLRDYPPEETKSYKPTGRPVGWHWMTEFVDKDGNVFHRGKEQPKLFGTLKPTKVKPPKKKIKRRTKNQILVASYKEKQILKKAKKLAEKKIRKIK